MKAKTIIFRLAAAKKDPALRTRGARKNLVTEIYPATEELAKETEWRHQTSSGKCPVVLTKNTESAVFTQVAEQTRHYHKTGTEIYVVLEGKMRIEIGGKDFVMLPGDTIIVFPGAYHEIRRAGEFISRVFTVNCGGAKDKYPKTKRGIAV